MPGSSASHRGATPNSFDYQYARQNWDLAAEQVRSAARRSGEREVALLNATVKEQSVEV